MKVHLSLPTRDLNASVEFYRTLLDAAPTKHYDDYALFLTEDPGLELALAMNPRAEARSDEHYGLAVDTPNLVTEAIQRLMSKAYPIDIETAETCCYATQNKVWATDPDGRRWETYFVIAESEDRESEDMSCCREAESGESACCPT
jgi:catechol 2,3-dioxygenase-like lactoylglutathione lyase family enzyme